MGDRQRARIVQGRRSIVGLTRIRAGFDAGDVAGGWRCGPVVGLGDDAETVVSGEPLRLSAQQRSGALAALVEALEAAGAEVWEPFARNDPLDKTAPGWAYRVGQADLRDVRTADGLFAVVNGCPPDEGVMVELGLAIAWGKPTFLFRDDFRRCADSGVYPLNLMLFAGLPESGWESYWYGSVEEIADPDKALARWLLDRTHPGARRATGP